MVLDSGRPFIPECKVGYLRSEVPRATPGTDNMHSASSEFVFNVLRNERCLIIQMDESATDAGRSEGIAKDPFYRFVPLPFRRRRFRFQVPGPASRTACATERKTRVKVKKKGKRKDEKGTS